MAPSESIPQPIFTLRESPGTLLLDASTLRLLASWEAYSTLTEDLFPRHGEAAFIAMALRKQAERHFLSEADEFNLSYLGYILAFLEEWVLADRVIIDRGALETLRIHRAGEPNAEMDHLVEALFEVVEIDRSRLTEAASNSLAINDALHDKHYSHLLPPLPLDMHIHDLRFKDDYHASIDGLLGQSNNTWARALYYFELARLIGAPLLLHPEKAAHLQSFGFAIASAAKSTYQNLTGKVRDSLGYSETQIPIPPIADAILQHARQSQGNLIQAAIALRETHEVRSLKNLITDLRAFDSVSRCQAGTDRLNKEASRIAKALCSKRSPEDTFSRRVIHLGELPNIGWLLKLTGMGRINVPDIDFSEPACVALFHRWARPSP